MANDGANNKALAQNCPRDELTRGQCQNKLHMLRTLFVFPISFLYMFQTFIALLVWWYQNFRTSRAISQLAVCPSGRVSSVLASLATRQKMPIVVGEQMVGQHLCLTTLEVKLPLPGSNLSLSQKISSNHLLFERITSKNAIVSQEKGLSYSML